MSKKLTQQEFIDRSNIVHGEIYDYSMVEYVNSQTKVKIYCEKHDVMFIQISNSHLLGNTGCKKCSGKKRKQTCFVNHGVEYPQQSKKIQDKSKQTNIKHLGVENPSQSTKIQDKKRKTCLLVYGVENPSQSTKIQDKKRKTCLKNHGVEYPFQSKEVQKKSRETCLKNHGVDNPAYSNEVQDKKRKTCLLLYGVENPAQKHISKKSLDLLNIPAWLIEQHHIQKQTLIKIGEVLGVNESTIGIYFKKHNIEVKNFMFSMGEKEVLEYITTILPLKTTIHSNIRTIIKPFELDIFLPEYKLAIEYNGVYWHGTPEARKKDALKKYLCEKQGINLLTIWEHRWLNNKQLVKYGLRTILKNYGKNKNNQ